MKGLSVCIAALMSVALISSGSVAFGQSVAASSNFDINAEGWRVADLPQSLGNPPVVVQYWDVEWSAGGGNPFGYVHLLDTGNDWFWFTAPAKFLGDQSAAYGNALSFDLACTGNDGVPYAGVILVGSGYALFRELPPPGTSFTSYVVPLSEDGWHVGAVDGPITSAAQMQQMLSSLTALYINADWQTGYETTSLDNVVLVPEPAGLGIVLIGVCLTRCASRRLLLGPGLSSARPGSLR